MESRCIGKDVGGLRGVWSGRVTLQGTGGGRVAFMRLAVSKPGIQTGRRGQGKAVPDKRKAVCVAVVVDGQAVVG